MADIVYLKLSESCLADKKKVKVKDVAKVLSANADLRFGVENLELMSFSGSKEQQVISVMYILQLIHQRFPDCTVMPLGATDVVVYYRTYDTSDKVKQIMKFVFICLVAFFGAGFSIMSYNSDVNMVGQLDVMKNIFVGKRRRHIRWQELHILWDSL